MLTEGRRLWGLVRKETLQIVRDPSSIAIAFVLPLILLLIHGYGISLDAEVVPVGVVLESDAEEARSFAAALEASSAFRTTLFRNRTPATRALLTGHLDAVVVLPPDLERRLRGPGTDPAVQAVVDGVDANHGRLVRGYLERAWTQWVQERIVGAERGATVNLAYRIWFNPELRSRHYLVPGLIAIIMTLIGAMLTALVVAREWERGTMEALLVSPISVNQFLLGKVLPYFLLGMAGMAFTTAIALFLFQVPLRGSLPVLFGAGALFLLAALGMGLFISTVARSQFIAAQVAILATFLPAFILSGFIFDIQSMPWPVQALTYLLAARYFVSILQTVFLAGDVWAVILPNAAALLGMAVLFLGLTRARTRKRLE
ncbi:ABC transporter permease [Thiohalorhabdus methylotrophus]|uniref:ABC transporter permease n=1 Tax=Thiohalorhabdus methylotrophus TaxID=3242694 RepID=A0ABV4TS89_9GAMM